MKTEDEIENKILSLSGEHGRTFSDEYCCWYGDRDRAFQKLILRWVLE
jgi:hypothetical protein